jgi:hypothetical protein
MIDHDYRFGACFFTKAREDSLKSTALQADERLIQDQQMGRSGYGHGESQKPLLAEGQITHWRVCGFSESEAFQDRAASRVRFG